MTPLLLKRSRFAPLLSVTLLLVFANALGQKLDNTRPTVYITFKEFIEKTSNPAHPSQGARLVLHNNTRWPIYYSKDYDPTAATAQIIYIIERADGCPEVREHVDVIMRYNKLMPGKTLYFIVRRDGFLKDSEIYVQFHFSWELRGGETVRRESLHRAYFISNDLPPWTK